MGYSAFALLQAADRPGHGSDERQFLERLLYYDKTGSVFSRAPTFMYFDINSSELNVGAGLLRGSGGGGGTAVLHCI